MSAGGLSGGVEGRDERGQGGSDEVWQRTGHHDFALSDFPHRPDGDPRDDLDLASPGIVKVYEDRTGDTYPDLPWEPKAAFAIIADHYSRQRVRPRP